MGEILNISGIDCYEKNGVAYLKLETVARGLGFTETKGGKEYVMWRRVNGYLADFNFDTSAERPDFIPENILYRIVMKAKNEVAENKEDGIVRKLNDEEMKQFAEMMEMPFERVKSFAEILFEEKRKGNLSLRYTNLDNVDGYFRERENNWYFYHNWQALIQSEVDQADAGLTEEECEKLVGKMIFKLSDGWYVQTVL